LTGLLAIFLESKELKKLIVSRSVEFEIPLKFMCEELDLNYSDFMRSYINVQGASKLDISEEKIIELLAFWGIDLRYQFVIDSSVDMRAFSKKIAENNEIKVQKIRLLRENHNNIPD
jgi:hypothetical protein